MTVGRFGNWNDFAMDRYGRGWTIGTTGPKIMEPNLRHMTRPTNRNLARPEDRTDYADRVRPDYD
jgi:hypothetical protein